MTKTVEDYQRELDAIYEDEFGKNAKLLAARICRFLGFEVAQTGNASRKYMKLTRREGVGTLWIGRGGAVRSGARSSDSTSVTDIYKRQIAKRVETEKNLEKTRGATTTAHWKTLLNKNLDGTGRNVLVVECETATGETYKFSYSTHAAAREACETYGWTPADEASKEILLDG